MKNVVYCDFCKKDFVIVPFEKKVTLRERGKPLYVNVQYFRCPHCGNDYTIAVTDAVLRKMIKRRDSGVTSREAELMRLYQKYRLEGDNDGQKKRNT